MPLTLGIRFLTGYCATARSKLDPRPEWPPHPARVFLALAAAYFECFESDGPEGDALRWLETLPPPSIHFSINVTADNDAVSTFVPMNDLKSVGKGGTIQTIPEFKRHRAERSFPRAHLPEMQDTIYYTWNETTGVEVHGQSLENLCAQIGRLGHSTSLVHVFLADPPAADAYLTLEPTELQGEKLRVISNTAGTLEKLAAAYVTGNNRPRGNESRGQSYRVKPSPSAPLATTIFDEHFEILRLESANDSFRYLQLETTLALTSTLHRAILERCPQPVPQAISGHQPDGAPSKDPHMALIPLAFVGRPHADGHLLGVGVVLPRNAGSDVIRDLEHAFQRIAGDGDKGGTGLGFDSKRFPGLGQWRLIREGPFDEFRTNLRTTTWTAADEAGSKSWASVTPVVFDQHAKAKEKGAYLNECIMHVKEMVRHVIAEDVEISVEIRPVSVFAGVPSTNSFPRMKRKDGSQRRHTHVVLHFSRPIIGPLMIGTGRFRGYGLCRPLYQENHHA